MPFAEKYKILEYHGKENYIIILIKNEKNEYFIVYGKTQVPELDTKTETFYFMPAINNATFKVKLSSNKTGVLYYAVKLNNVYEFDTAVKIIETLMEDTHEYK